MNSTEYTSIDDYLFAEINKIREDPTYIIPALEALEDNFSTINTLEYKTPGRFAILTTEGYAAVQEAIDELNSATALDPLTRQEGMNNACQDHVADATEITGNIGTDDSTPFDRIDKYGLATGEE